MDIINGLDGQYVVFQGKLLKIVGIITSENWYKTTDGWIEYTFENGMKITMGNKNR
ncbi:MAG: hypothetical protein UT24_C0016G0043 [Candidatus Woesebacteria bacterium GW2011_GWB1_39_12]|uniref:Uncharacterized protein n=1 Tax=Candidatus Woesebacteria bacterium GW2011_GWB1_39_12 TaxID=1618574 RepID=A0A0G0M7Q7_9BACT|nr:MAG: hypothetical protein UT24_C0016G0043 [Candidatus Woesebacteria bacterium GW2011_GWB1_39_12]